MPKGKYTFKTVRQELPNGLIKRVEMIDHPGAVLIVPFISSRKVVLVRQYRPTFKRYLYEFPCGTLDPGESPLTCARRELAEETGYGGRQFRKLGEIYPAPGYTNEIIHLYTARELHPQTAECDDDEIITVRLLSRAQIQDMVAQHKIKDAKTICALALCGWLR